MRLGIKGKQVLGVTTIVGVVVVVLSVIGLARLAEVSLDESHARAELLGNAIIHRAHEVDVGTGDPFQALRADPGLRSILEASLYGNDVTFAAIVDSNGVSAMSADPSQEQQPIHAAADLDELLSRSSFSKLTAIYRDQGRNLDYSTPLLLGDQPIGSVRIGVSTLLIRRDLNRSLGPAAITALGALGVAVFGATILAQLLLRPIHVIRSGLTRLGKGEKDVQLDLGEADEFGELGTFFNTVSAQIAADRSQMAGHVANLESAVQQLEDAVAIVGPDGRLLFANPALRVLAPAAGVGARLSELVPAQHPLRLIAEDALNTRQSRGPTAATFASATGEQSERILIANPVNDAKGGLVGVMVVARNLEYLSEVQSTLRYSRKLAALGRLSQGVAHEVKNPLNAMMIHLELLRQYVAPSALSSARGTGGKPLGIAAVDSGPPPQALEHIDVIAREIRRLDDVVQGFLKFSRPEDLKLQPVDLAELLAEVVPIVKPEADQRRVQIVVDAHGSPEVNGDPTMLRQAILNLALNACQAMPDGGGTVTIGCEPARGRRVKVTVADTGLGIKPEHLQRIFDLYFTTKERGSGIGLSMVYRTVQMHDGEIEVQSTPGKGTTFTIFLPQA